MIRKRRNQKATPSYFPLCDHSFNRTELAVRQPALGANSTKRITRELSPWNDQ